jgi:hypothetical protein
LATSTAPELTSPTAGFRVTLDNASILKDLIYRIVGAPPASGATRGERLRWVRKFYRFNLAAIVLVVIFALLGGGTFLWIVAAVMAGIWVSGVASISMSIHREGSGSR